MSRHDIWHHRAARTLSNNQTDDVDRSIRRLLNAETHKARTAGFGTTKQGQALAREYREQLTVRIGADRVFTRNNKEVWRALKGATDEDLAIRLLVAGISVSEPGDLGADEDGQKNFRDQALWVGRNLCHEGRELRLKVGGWGIDMLLELPAFALDVGDVLKMTACVDALMDDVLVRAVRNNALLSPLGAPPADWTQVRAGGVSADDFAGWVSEPLIREHHRSIEEAARNAIGRGRMQKVLDAVNSLQRVPFTINEPILKIILQERPLFPGSKPPFWQREKFERWAEKKAEFESFYFDTLIAQTMSCLGRFWVALNMDFRGRLNPISHFSFIREDRIRALFLFADGEPIGEDGLWWLKGHVARSADGNAWSGVKKPSKLTRDGRVAWTDANEKTLRRIGEAVLRGDDPATLEEWLKDLSDPYQFLAACAEFAEALNVGPGFITRLPLMFDATCSGLQHLCAMTRAEEGRYVNLTADDKPDDFYGRIAETVSKVTPALMKGPNDREIVKQPVMSYFYGSRKGGFSKSNKGPWRPYGMVKQVVDVLKERGQSTKGAKELAHATYDAIEGRVPRAKAVRDFLERLAKICAENGKPLRWTTLLGLPVINEYHQAEIVRVAVPLNGRRHCVKLAVGDKDEIDPKRAANAVTANFVHSVDATHLQMVALVAAKEDIKIVPVHDCYGCLAPRAERLNVILREEFVRLHRHNLLEEVLASARRAVPHHVEWPSSPPVGNLDIEEVLKSPNAFR